MRYSYLSFCSLFQASKKQKLFLMSWCPDTAKVKKKMLYSSSFDALKKSLVGVQKYIQVTFLASLIYNQAPHDHLVNLFTLFSLIGH